MGRSQAQDKLQRKIEELYPYASVSDEVYIGDLVTERGYSLDEMESELGHKPHKMFVDIVLREADRTVAFEYHGEQHYSVVGAMVKNAAELAAAQKRDREKSWLLSRIGIPLVAVPYDMYVDLSTLEAAIDDAFEEMSAFSATLDVCCECGRAFPDTALDEGMCASCIEKVREYESDARQEEYEEYLAEQRERAREWYDSQQDDEDRKAK
ncbi:MAG: hypothetical protein BZ138_06550, partial [Methanosphaera sp. rholeuAM270]